MNYLIANWKMNLTIRESLDLLRCLSQKSSFLRISQLELVVCPSYVALPKVAESLKTQNLKLGAQNCSSILQGAFTGEVSARDLKDLGCQYVIIGHSERRIYFNETEEAINSKIKLLLKESITPILCAGETREERDNGQTARIIKDKITTALRDVNINSKKKIIVAYEPLWSISTNIGKVMTQNEAEEGVILIKKIISSLVGQEILNKNFDIIYGGSVDSTNITSFFTANISGVLIGGASAKANEFIKMIEKVKNLNLNN